MSADERERLARVALNRLTEPGDLRLAALTDELGALTLHRLLAEERDLMGLQTDVAARLTGIEPERELEQAGRLGLRFVVPGDDEWPV
ncbi:MAG: DNA-protecting protein DprA, partial [Nocardioides sp.]|nr:DNA-protecting protein DprA [Nocardioides sp.]